MSCEHATSREVAETVDAVLGLAGMVKTRAKRLDRDAHELLRLAAQMEHAAGLLVHPTPEGIRNAS